AHRLRAGSAGPTGHRPLSPHHGRTVGVGDPRRPRRPLAPAQHRLHGAADRRIRAHRVPSSRGGFDTQCQGRMSKVIPMAEIHRFSSRRQRLDHAFLANRLKGAKSYKRIAGYFRSSIFELVGEEIADIPHVQIVCNSELDAADVVVSKHVRETALKERWNEAPAEVEALLHKDRYRSLHALLTSGR